MERIRLDVCNLGRTEVILGMPWLVAHNPDINWETGDVMETLDSTELFMEDQTWLDYLWDFETRGINLDLPSDTD